MQVGLEERDKKGGPVPPSRTGPPKSCKRLVTSARELVADLALDDLAQRGVLGRQFLQ